MTQGVGRGRLACASLSSLIFTSTVKKPNQNEDCKEFAFFLSLSMEELAPWVSEGGKKLLWGNKQCSQARGSLKQTYGWNAQVDFRSSCES